MRLAILALVSLSLCAQSASRPPQPKAIPARPAATLEQLRQSFGDPPAEYRSMPLWVWNDEMNPARMTQMLEQYKRQGLGGAFVHPRPGLITEYLGNEWFSLWRHSLNEGKRLGLLVSIYDENSYPSGFAGGHVPSRAPDTVSQYVAAETGLPASAVSTNPLNVAFFAGPKGQMDKLRRVRTRDEVKPGEEVVSFKLRRASGNPWNGDFPYVDLTNPRTAPEFLKTTYEAYKREFGTEFGKSIKWAFTDEPLLATSGSYDNYRMGLPLSFNTLAEFRKRNGYDLADEIPSLYWDTGDFRKVRFDYWQTLHDLWKENFMKPMFEWCDANGLQFTGHWMEHEWPAPWITPADASLYAYEHVPGIDMLEGSNLRLNGRDPHMLFTIRQVASVSHQLGRRAFCEAYGVAGWDSTFEHYKRFGDWLMVNGINFMDQHLSFSTIRGARKRDHPQSFSDVSAWWPYYRTHADHLARVSYLSSVSSARHRVLVIHATTTGFLLARRDGSQAEMNALRDSNAGLNQFLADHQVDYDLGDEYMLEWFGAVKDGKLTVGKGSYDLVVLPQGLTNLRKQTLPLLEAWLKAGGHVLALDAPPAYVDGRPNGTPARLRADFGAQWHQLNSNPGLVEEIRKRLGARIEIDAPVGFSERFLETGERVLFLTNSGLTPVNTQATIAAGSLEMWDTVSGRMMPAVYTASGGRLTFPVDLAPAASLLLIARPAAAKAAVASKPDWQAVAAPQWNAQPESLANTLVLDYCDLTVGGETLKDINTWQANWTLWQRHGFERPAWDNAVQFKRTVLDRNKFGKDSGFSASFRFTLPAGPVPADLRLAVELPELYKVSLNGKPVNFTTARTWLDPHLKAAPVAALAKAGENEVVISAAPFDVRMELENIYLLGSFSLDPAEKGFAISAQRPLSLGSWVKLGRPFDSGSALYTAKVAVPAGHNRIKVDLKDWHGSLAELLIDGKRTSILGWPPYSAEAAVPPGEHTVTLKVVSTPRNTMGPFHHPSKPRMRAWPAAWAEFPVHQPAGSAYQLIDYGLFEAPALFTAAVR